MIQLQSSEVGQIVKAEKADIDILRKVREHVRNGTYILREHAIKMQEKRRISLADVLRVLEYGKHEKEKDIFEVKNQRWKHAIRGKTLNGADLRVIVAFHAKLAIITVIKVG